jgi:hypothetical protein
MTQVSSSIDVVAFRERKKRFRCCRERTLIVLWCFERGKVHTRMSDDFLVLCY